MLILLDYRTVWSESEAPGKKPRNCITNKRDSLPEELLNYQTLSQRDGIPLSLLHCEHRPVPMVETRASKIICIFDATMENVAMTDILALLEDTQDGVEVIGIVWTPKFGRFLGHFFDRCGIGGE